jgi:hypothetical protein
MATKSCPYTTIVTYSEQKKGTLIESDPLKKDGIFEVGEDLQYLIEYHNRATHVTKPLYGIQVTIRDPNMKVTTKVTDTKGKIYLDVTRPGRWLLSYYDKYQKRSVVVSFNAVEPVKVNEIAETDTFTIEDGPKDDGLKKRTNFLDAIIAFMQRLKQNKNG